MSESDEATVAAALNQLRPEFGEYNEHMPTPRDVTALLRDLRERCFDRWVRHKQGVSTHPEEVDLVASPAVEVTDADREAARAWMNAGADGLAMGDILVVLSRHFAEHRARSGGSQ